MENANLSNALEKLTYFIKSSGEKKLSRHYTCSHEDYYTEVQRLFTMFLKEQ